jgi:hypothetical protein
MRPLLVTFVGGQTGPWVVERLDTVAGEPLDGASRLEVAEGPASSLVGGEPAWALRDVASNERYVSGVEQHGAVEEAGVAWSSSALIPITKSDVWWELPQAERRRTL